MSNQWPVKISGPLRAGNYKINGSFSSQILSGLLIALPLCHSDSEIVVDNLKSKTYVDMTISVMAAFGVECSHWNYSKFNIKGNQIYKGTEYAVEGDWSAAANLLVAAAISGNITIRALEVDSKQADVQILTALEQYGAKISILNPRAISVQKNENKPFNFDATDCPDLFPPLVVLAASCQGQSKIKGIHRLIHKESNRLESLKDIFSKLGLKLHSENDELIIKGSGQLTGNAIDSHNDHRIAMSGAIAATLTNTPIFISNTQCVKKSYPNFFEDLEKVKA
jgi:3-phosphoshikimate 1-carboxyvinyltransferase